MKIAFYTLGCKLNQSETFSIANQLHSSGYEVVSIDKNPDVCIINTCTVTNHSDQRSRQMIRKFIKDHPSSLIIVTGCYAERAPDELKKISGVTMVIGNSDKKEIVNILNKMQNRVSEKIETDIYKTVCGEIGKTRTFIKIQDGCDASCSYCIVPKVRGKSRSIANNDILAEISKAVKLGYPEIVLTGVHIGAYGKDISENLNLAALLKEALKICQPARIRLSSIEPEEITDELIEIIISSKYICRHLHIPLQSGTDEILKKMNRNYTIKKYINLLNKINSISKEISLGTDIITGFPGESEILFNNTLEIIHSLPFSYIHVFPYSRREGTEAYNLNETVSSKENERRVRLIREISNKKLINFKKMFIEKTLSAVIETTRNKQTGKLVGLTDNYIKVLLNGSNDLVKKTVQVKIKEITEDSYVYGEIL